MANMKSEPVSEGFTKRGGESGGNRFKGSFCNDDISADDDFKVNDAEFGHTWNELEANGEDAAMSSHFALVDGPKKVRRKKRQRFILVQEKKAKNKKRKRKNMCDVCKEVMTDELSLHEHTKDKHVNDTGGYFCEFCLKTFKTKAILKCHRQKHISEPQFLCVRCGKKYFTVSKLNEHTLYCTDEKRFECPVCAKKFNVNKQFKRHMVIHESDRYIKCTVCDQTFSRKDNYRQHYRKHTGEKPFKCRCGKSFRIKATYNYHVKTHLPNEIFHQQGELKSEVDHYQPDDIAKVSLPEMQEAQVKPGGMGFADYQSSRLEQGEIIETKSVHVTTLAQLPSRSEQDSSGNIPLAEFGALQRARRMESSVSLPEQFHSKREMGRSTCHRTYLVQQQLN